VGCSSFAGSSDSLSSVGVVSGGSGAAGGVSCGDGGRSSATFCRSSDSSDLSASIKEFKQMQFFMDPDAFLLRVKYRIERVKSLFNNPFYYGANVSLFKRAVLGLALPFTWATVFSSTSPGVPLDNPVLKMALGSVTGVLAQEAGFLAQNTFEKKVPAQKQRKLFHKSGGIIRERLFVDIALWAADYGKKRFIDGKKISPISYFGRRAGEYGIQHVYLHFLIQALQMGVRGGGVRAAYWCLRKVGLVISKMGFCAKNPFDSARTGIRKKFVDSGVLQENQELEEVLVYPAAIFPGAFARAVKRVVSRKAAADVLAKDPKFISYLNHMHGIAVYDLLRLMAVNPLVHQEMSARVVRIKDAVSASQWKCILKEFVSELFIEVFLDRQRLICQAITEPLLSVASAPLLNKMYKMLPGESE